MKKLRGQRYVLRHINLFLSYFVSMFNNVQFNVNKFKVRPLASDQLHSCRLDRGSNPCNFD